jgi:hypothetical protein
MKKQRALSRLQSEKKENSNRVRVRSMPSFRLLFVAIIIAYVAALPVFVQAAPAAVAVAQDGSIMTIDSSGDVSKLLQSNFTTGPSCTYDPSTSTFFSLQRGLSKLSSPSSSHRGPFVASAHARLVGITIPSGLSFSHLLHSSIIPSPYQLN